MIHVWANTFEHPWYGTSGVFTVIEEYSQSQEKIDMWKEEMASEYEIGEEVLKDPSGYQETL
jgi:hypothetical protein